MSIEITTEFLADLKAKAEAATPGPWAFKVWSGQGTAVHIKQQLVAGNGAWVASYVNANCADYIAAANPAVVLALIAHIKKLEAENHDLRNLQDPHALTAAHMIGYEKGRDEARAKIERLEKEADWLAEQASLTGDYIDGQDSKEVWRELARRAVEEQC